MRPSLVYFCIIVYKDTAFVKPQSIKNAPTRLIRGLDACFLIKLFPVTLALRA